MHLSPFSFTERTITRGAIRLGPFISSDLSHRWLVGWLWTKHHILLGPRRYFTSDPPLVELSPCSKDGQGEGEAADIAHQPISQGIEPGTTESVDREQSPEPPAPLSHRWVTARAHEFDHIRPGSSHTHVFFVSARSLFRLSYQSSSSQRCGGWDTSERDHPH